MTLTARSVLQLNRNNYLNFVAMLALKSHNLRVLRNNKLKSSFKLDSSIQYKKFKHVSSETQNQAQTNVNSGVSFTEHYSSVLNPEQKAGIIPSFANQVKDYLARDFEKEKVSNAQEYVIAKADTIINWVCLLCNLFGCD